MQPRTVVLVGALSLATGWLAATALSPDPQVAALDQRGPRPLGLGRQEPAAPFTQQLRLKMQEQPRSPSSGRNPFAFGARRPAALPSRSRASAGESAAAEPPAIPVVETRPLRGLSGVAMNRLDGADVFTAILSDNGALLFAKAGDRLPGGDTVLRVEERAVVIVDAAGAERTLRLK